MSGRSSVSGKSASGTESDLEPLSDTDEEDEQWSSFVSIDRYRKEL